MDDNELIERLTELKVVGSEMRTDIRDIKDGLYAAEHGLINRVARIEGQMIKKAERWPRWTVYTGAVAVLVAMLGIAVASC